MAEPRPSRVRRLARGLALLSVGGVGGVLALVVVGVGGGVLYLRSEAGNERLRGLALEQAAPFLPGGRLRVEGLETDLFTGLALRGVSLEDSGGRPLLSFDALRLRYDLRGAPDKRLVIEELALIHPTIDLTVLPTGQLDLLAALGLPVASPPEPAPASPAPFIDVPADIDVRDVNIDGLRLRYRDPNDPVNPVDMALDGLTLRGALRVAGRRADLRGLALRLDGASGLGAALPLPVSLAADLAYDAGEVQVSRLELVAHDTTVQLSGAVHAVEADDRSFDLALRAPRLAEADIDALAAQDVLLGDLALEAQVRGPLSALQVAGAVQTPGGPLQIDATIDALADVLGWRFAVATGGLDVHRVTPLVTAPVHLNLELDADGKGVGPLEAIEATVRLRARDQVVYGEPLSLLSLDGSLSRGLFTLQGLEAAHPAGRVRARGVIEPLAERATLTSVRADLPNLGALARFGVRGLKGRAGFDGRVAVEGWGGDGEAQVEGDVQVDGFAFQDAVTLQRLDGPLSATYGLKSGRVQASGDARLQGLHSPSADVAGLGLGWAATVNRGVVEVETRVALTELSVGEGALTIERIDTNGDALLRGGVDGSGEPWATGELSMSRMLLGTARYPAEGGAIGFALRDPASGSAAGKQLVLEFELDRGLDAPMFGGKVQGDLLTGEWRIDDLLLAPTGEHPMRATEPVTFKLVEGGAREVVLHIESDVGSVNFDGDLVPDTRDGTNFKGSLKDVDLAWFARVFKLFVAAPEGGVSPVEGLSGLASMDVELHDAGGAMSGDLVLALRDVSYPNYAQNLVVDAEIHGPIIRPELTARVAGPDGLLAAGDGELPLAWVEGRPQLDCAAEVRLEALVAPGPLPRFRKVFPQADAPDVDLSAAIKASGPACDPDIGLVAAGTAPLGRNGERLRVDLSVHREHGDLVLLGAVEESLQRRLQITGTASTQLEALFAGLFGGQPMPQLEVSSFVKDINLSVVPLNVPLSALGPYAALPRGVSGRVAGGLNIAGPPLRPVMSGGFVWVEGQLGRVGVDQAMLTLLPTEGGYALAGAAAFSEGGRVALDGALPLTIDLERGADQDLGREGLLVRLEGSGVPLAASEGLVEGLGDAAGRLQLLGTIDGTLAAPKPHLQVRLTEGAISAEATGVRYDAMDVDLGLESDRIELRHVGLRSTPRQGLASELRQGQLDLSGDIALKDWAPVATDLKLDADGFWLSATNQAQLRVNSKITVKGDFPALAVKGKVEVTEGRITLADDVFMESSDLAIDPRLAITRRIEDEEQVSRRGTKKAGPSAWESFDIALKIDLHSGLRLIADIPTYADAGAAAAKLSTAAVDLELNSPELLLGVKGGAPSLSGVVELPRGTVGIMGSSFDLTGGTLSFLGADYANPQLDIKAVRHTGAYGDVAAAISGSVDEMAIAFQSDDYPDQTDIVSILLFGKPASELAESEGQAGAAMLTSALAMAAGNSVSRAFGASFLRQVEFDGEAVRVGLPLSDKTLLSLERHMTTDDEDNVFAVSLEWLITRRMYAEMVTGDKGQSSADVYMRWRF
jgi:hypothetical protein